MRNLRGAGCNVRKSINLPARQPGGAWAGELKMRGKAGLGRVGGTTGGRGGAQTGSRLGRSNNLFGDNLVNVWKIGYLQSVYLRLDASESLATAESSDLSSSQGDPCAGVEGPLPR